MSTLETFFHDALYTGTIKENFLTAIENNLPSALLAKVNVLLNDITGQSAAVTTTSTSLVMAGYGKTFTPKSTGRVLILLITEANNNTAGDGVSLQINYGTGTAPSSGAAVTGTQASPAASITAAAASANVTVTLFAIVTGLTIGTSYWLDLAYAAVTGGTAAVQIKGAMVVEF